MENHKKTKVINKKKNIKDNERELKRKDLGRNC